jgi:hypothetical protein
MMSGVGVIPGGPQRVPVRKTPGVVRVVRRSRRPRPSAITRRGQYRAGRRQPGAFVRPGRLTQDSGPWSLGASTAPSYVPLMQTHAPMQPLEDEAIGGPIIGADHHRVKAYPRDRVCQFSGCSTRLSVYNHGSLCAAHDRFGIARCVHVARTGSRRAARSSHRRAARAPKDRLLGARHRRL